MKSIKGICKDFWKKLEQSKNMKSDLFYINQIETEILGISDEVFSYIMNQEGELQNRNSSLEKFISKINSNCESPYYQQEKMISAIDNFEAHILKVFDRYADKIRSTKNKEVLEQYKAIKVKIQAILSEMREIASRYNNAEMVKPLLLNKCISMSSNLEEYMYNLSNQFSNLKGDIEEYYDKKERNLKCVAIGGAAAVIVGGAGITTVSIVEHKGAQVLDALVEIYGSEEEIPEYIYNEYFEENGLPKVGATEKIKEKLLSETLENIVNDELGKVDEDICIESVELDYYNDEYTEEMGRGPKVTERDGYTIRYTTNKADETYYIEEADVYETVQRDEIREHIDKNKEAVKIRKWLEGLSIKDCVEIFKGGSLEREEFKEKFENSILKMKNMALEKSLESNDRQSENEMEF